MYESQAKKSSARLPSEGK